MRYFGLKRSCARRHWSVFATLSVVVASVLGVVALSGQGSGEPGEHMGRGVASRSEGPVPAYDGHAESLLLPEDGDYVFPIDLSEDQWRGRLEPHQYATLREKRTERAGTGTYDGVFRDGIYYSAASGQPLFRSKDKYESGTGWPSYTRPISPDAVYYRVDTSSWSTRIEIIDSLSGSHLGHVFQDGPDPTGLRYCMNSAALIFVPYSDDPPANLYDWDGILNEDQAAGIRTPELTPG